MGKVYLICGKLCSGKTYYSKALKEKYNAVLLSTDEATYDLINNEQGSFYDEFSKKVNLYLRKKAAEICLSGANVILDWGFWTRESREEISRYFDEKGVDFEWHYIDVSDETWHGNIEERNKRILDGCGGSDFYVNEGLLRKVLSLFEAPSRDEIDVWHTPDRTV